jgi:hypothetical protein
MKLKISDVTWKIQLLTVDKFTAKNGENCYGITDTDAKVIDFRRDAVTAAVVRHEIFHAYFTLSLVASSNLSMDQTEEVCAELMGKYGEQYIRDSRKVFNYLQKRMKNNEKI